MRDCLVLGSGRSGTSMMSGVLAAAGYFMGENLYRARHSNPKGIFENAQINGINEHILSPYAAGGVDGQRTTQAPGAGQFWLLNLDEAVSVECREPELADRLRSMVGRRPFAYKDPRFCYTLPVWQPYLSATCRYIVMIRRPDVTVASILKECEAMPYLADLDMDVNRAQQVWTNLYRHVLKHYRRDPERFTFVHYDQLFDDAALARVSEILGVQLSSSFVDPSLNRTKRGPFIDEETWRIYEVVCDIAGYKTG